MAIYVKPSWRKYIPHLDIYVNIPLITVQMMVMQEEVMSLTFTYLGLYWRIHKWEGRIKLFDIGNRLSVSVVENDDAKVDSCGCWYSAKYKLQYYCDKHKKV